MPRDNVHKNPNHFPSSPAILNPLTTSRRRLRSTMSDYLPQELIIQILTRLPPKSLLRFRCVCKSWRSLISSPNFISTHTHQHTLSTHNPRKIVRTYSTSDNKEHYAIHFDNGSFDLDPESQIKFPFECIPRYYFRIVGCCNGLLCLSDDLFGYTNTVILWNPVIRRRLDLPSPQVSLHDVSVQYMYALGFGFDSRMNDFKVVRIAYVQNHSGYSVPPMVEVYTVKGGVWRNVNSGSPPPVYCIVDYFWSQAFVNGVVHWVAYDQVGGHGGRVTSLIMSFDMNNEVFSEIVLPGCLIRESPINMNTAVVRELLSVIQCDRTDMVNTGKCCSIWVMKEYGVANSWCKLCNIDIGVTLGRALDVKKNGEILLGENCGVMVSYNPRTKGVKTLEIYGSRASIYVDTYRESLALLLEGDEIWGGPSSDSESDSSEEDDEGEESNVERSETWIQMVTVQFLSALLTEH